MPIACRFTVGDVFFAELFVTYVVCMNGADIFKLETGELFECDLGTDMLGYKQLVAKFKAS